MLSRIAVLPPSDATGRPLSEVQGGIDGYDAPSQSLATLLADEAGQQLARYGFDVGDPPSWTARLGAVFRQVPPRRLR